jgi:hypothetical protein
MAHVKWFKSKFYSTYNSSDGIPYASNISAADAINNFNAVANSYNYKVGNGLNLEINGYISVVGNTVTGFYQILDTGKADFNNNLLISVNTTDAAIGWTSPNTYNPLNIIIGNVTFTTSIISYMTQLNLIQTDTSTYLKYVKICIPSDSENALELDTTVLDANTNYIYTYPSNYHIYIYSSNLHDAQTKYALKTFLYLGGSKYNNGSSISPINYSIQNTFYDLTTSWDLNLVDYSSLYGYVCFAANTPITTNQGNIPIQSIDPDIHTIRNKKIVAITKTYCKDKYLICFEKDSLGKNIPSEKTIMTKHHLIFHNKQMIPAKDFVQMFDKVYKIKYNEETVYNVLMENYDKMIVNNLICETLHPKSVTAQVYKKLATLNPHQQEELIEEVNKRELIRHELNKIQKKKSREINI